MKFNDTPGVLLRQTSDIIKTRGPIWSSWDQAHVYLTSQLSEVVASKLQLPMPRTGRILIISVDAPGDGWNLNGRAHPFGPYGYTCGIADISDEHLMAGKLQDTFLDDIDGVFVVADNAAKLQRHLKRTGLFRILQRRIGKDMFYIGANAGSIMALGDLSHFVRGTEQTTGLSLVSRTILPFVSDPAVIEGLLRYNASIADPERHVLGIGKNEIAHFKDGVVSIR